MRGEEDERWKMEMGMGDGKWGMEDVGWEDGREDGKMGRKEDGR